MSIALDLELAPAPDHDIARVRIAGFEGPLALLLSLIETRELDVLTVPLGELAEAYLEVLAELQGERIGSLSGFVAVAAQLILIKSRAMLPIPPEPALGGEREMVDPEEELRRRLLLYRAFRDIAAGLAERLAAAGGGLFHREVAHVLAPTEAPRVRLEPLEPSLLVETLAGLVRVVPPPEPPPRRLERTISVEQRATLIREALRDAPLVVLQELLRGVRDRVLAAVTFLAVLELVKQQEISVEQEAPWGPIVCRRLA